jgi:hypothetical protein
VFVSFLLACVCVHSSQGVCVLELQVQQMHEQQIRADSESFPTAAEVLSEEYRRIVTAQQVADVELKLLKSEIWDSRPSAVRVLLTLFPFVGFYQYAARFVHANQHSAWPRQRRR